MRFNGDWHPAGTTDGRGYGDRPEVGDVVAFQHRAWTVTYVKVRDFKDEDLPRVAHYKPESLDKMRPYTVTLRRLYGPPHERENSRQECSWTVRSFNYGGFDRYEEGRVPLCSCCTHPWPCLEVDAKRAAERAMEKTERELALLPGCCPACQEPVTHRQRSIKFPGPYVHNPLAHPNPVFHLRRKCWGSAAAYEDKWVAADPTAPRSLLTLRCTGTLVVHGDGSGECFGAVNSDCPSIYARHGHMMACYIQSHGCGRECAREGHPGTRLADRPADPRDVTRVETLPLT